MTRIEELEERAGRLKGACERMAFELHADEQRMMPCACGRLYTRLERCVLCAGEEKTEDGRLKTEGQGKR